MRNRRWLFAILVALAPTVAQAGSREDAEAVFQRFLAAFTAADVDRTVDLFWPDALFWGTISPDLATTAEAVRRYFAPMAGFKPDERKATGLESSALVHSADVVLISGMWQLETLVNGNLRRIPLRVSMAVTRRGETWRIAQFHNSPQPSQ